MHSAQSTPENSMQTVVQIPLVNDSDMRVAATQSTVDNNCHKATTATVPVPQMRVLQAVSSKPDHTPHFQHHVQSSQQHLQNQQLHQIQILKAIPSSRGEIFIPSTLSTVSASKVSLSPNKGPAIVTVPRPKAAQVTKTSSKLKVGDTIVIPAKALNSFNPGSIAAQSILIKNEQGPPGHLLFSSTKFMPTVAKSPVPAKPNVSQQASGICSTTSQPQSSLLSNSFSSPSRLSTLSPSSWAPSPMRYKRPNEFHEGHDCFHDSIKKSRRALSAHEKGSKGLRHFAMLVCEKVKQKITTTYNEVADELVSEYSNTQRHFNDQQYDQKNIRRRVYDALNVLMAMNIIYKDKKDIHWVGLPTNSVQELQSLQLEKQKREQKIKQKTAQLHELILQQIAFKNLVQRNKQLQHAQGPPASNSAIQLPFIIVNTSKKTVIDCSISNDKYEYLFNFDNTFEIHDDIEVLKRMGMAYGLEKGTCSKDNLRMAQSLVPPVLRTYLEEMASPKRKVESTSTSSNTAHQTVYPCSERQSIPGAEQLSSSPLDGRQLLSSLKPDPEDREIEMMVEKNEENRNGTACVPAHEATSLAQSVAVESLNVFPSVQNPPAGFELNYLPPTTLAFPNFEN